MEGTRARASVGLLPGNGHVDDRLHRAREAVARLAPEDRFEVRSIDYRDDDSFERLLDDVRDRLDGVDLLYATGIGGLVALALRARGDLGGVPIVMQGPVLWGLETRRFPRVMRFPGMPRLLVLALSLAPVQRRFERKHFQRPLDEPLRTAFFGGYRDAGAFARWFAWLTPDLLRHLEGELRGRPSRLEGVEAWWGSLDHVVGPEELTRTESALGASIPMRSFPAWGHYPMIDAPDEWVREVSLALASAARV
ncbi:MAG: alpha/beta hydrolase [Planctomycetota bacterium]